MPDMDGDATAGLDNSPGGADQSAALTIGHRVVVRYRLPDGADHGATDVVGVLLARDADVLIVETPTGRVKLTRSEVIVAKDVPDAADRLGPAHRRVSADDLQRIMSDGWVGTELARLGDWQLRAASALTGRANSLLPVGDPSSRSTTRSPSPKVVCRPRPVDPLPGAQHARLWRRGDPVGRPSGTWLPPARACADWSRVLVMTAASAAVPELTPESVPVVGDAGRTRLDHGLRREQVGRARHHRVGADRQRR